MDIMLAKIEEKLSNDDIKYAFKKISNINIDEKEREKKERKVITTDDIEKIANDILKEKLTLEEIEEMLIEAHEAGKLLDEEKSKKKEKKDDKKDGERQESDEGSDDANDHKKKSEAKKTINLHEFKAILNWENNN